VETPLAPLVGLVNSPKLGSFLRLGPDPLSVALCQPSRLRWCVGVGVAALNGSVSWLGEAPDLPFGPQFGGRAFDPRRLWPGFAEQWWFVPRLLAWRSGAVSGLAAFGRDEAEARAAMQAVTETPRSVAPHATLLADDGEAYGALVGRALQAIDSGAFTKLVPARVLKVRAEDAFDPREVLRRLEVAHPNAVSFLVRGLDGSHFVGATPETLCEVRDGIVETEALAGTRAAGLEGELFESKKEREEHAVVVEAIRASLFPLVESLPPLQVPHLKRVGALFHLHTPITARLRAGVPAQAVVDALHPTPAVGGSPRVEALGWLEAHEGFSRGWYAGVVGARGPSQLSAFVALRSARLLGNEAHVFAGAGVVAGAQPSAEVLETRAKAQTMMSALGVD
jgi:salicylate biosynthesis isochorismate synthase